MSELEIDDNLTRIVDKLIYIVDNHEILNASDLRKYIYTKNLDEKDFIEFKRIFNKYGELNVFNCVVMYRQGQISKKKELLERIRGK